MRFWVFFLLVGIFLPAFANMTVYRTTDTHGTVLFTDKAPANMHHVKVIRLQTPTENEQLHAISKNTHSQHALNSNPLSTRSTEVTTTPIQETPSSMSTTTNLMNHKHKVSLVRADKIQALRADVSRSELMVKHESENLQAVEKASQSAHLAYTRMPSVNQKDDTLRRARLTLMENMVNIAKQRLQQASEQLHIAREELHHEIVMVNR